MVCFDCVVTTHFLSEDIVVKLKQSVKNIFSWTVTGDKRIGLYLGRDLLIWWILRLPNSKIKTLKVSLVDIVILKLYKNQGQRRLLNLIDHNSHIGPLTLGIGFKTSRYFAIYVSFSSSCLSWWSLTALGIIIRLLFHFSLLVVILVHSWKRHQHKLDLVSPSLGLPFAWSSVYLCSVDLRLKALTLFILSWHFLS